MVLYVTREGEAPAEPLRLELGRSLAHSTHFNSLFVMAVPTPRKTP